MRIYRLLELIIMVKSKRAFLISGLLFMPVLLFAQFNNNTSSPFHGSGWVIYILTPTAGLRGWAVLP